MDILNKEALNIKDLPCRSLKFDMGSEKMNVNKLVGTISHLVCNLKLYLFSLDI